MARVSAEAKPRKKASKPKMLHVESTVSMEVPERYAKALLDNFNKIVREELPWETLREMLDEEDLLIGYLATGGDPEDPVAFVAWVLGAYVEELLTDDDADDTDDADSAEVEGVVIDGKVEEA